MNTEHIIEVFSEYLDNKKTQYALLINGKWGCGKTYFWKNQLSRVATTKKLNPIYISLNGISSISDLESLLFIRLIPVIGKEEKNWFSNSVKVIGNVLNQTSKIFLKTDLNDLLKGVSLDSLDFSNYIICFDDLERCQIPVKETLGYINNFVEHKKLKSIFLADEPNIDKSQQGYASIKEKIIGRTINFETNIEDALPHLFERYRESHEEFHTFLLSKQNRFVELAFVYDLQNLRIIDFYLDLLKGLYGNIKDIEEDYMDEIIFFSLIITIEFKEGKLTSSDNKDFKKLDNIDEYRQSLSLSKNKEISKEEPKEYVQHFYEKYISGSVNSYFFYSSIYSYILSGFLDQIVLKEEIKDRYPDQIPIEIEEFRALITYKFRELDDSTFNKYSKSVLKYAKEGKYSIYDYVQLAKFYFYFSENKLVDRSVEEIILDLKTGLQIAKEKRQINNHVLDSIFHFGDRDARVMEIMKHVKEIHIEIRNEQLNYSNSEIIECLRKNNEFDLAEVFKKHFLSKEFLPYIDVDALLEAIKESSNKQLFNFTELLQDRYKSNNIGEFLYEDFDPLSELRRKLETYLNESEESLKPLRLFLFSNLEVGLAIILDKLNTTKK
ncbi:KAP family NTPase [Reichenbachiella carrageenanivorans]|uniref:KAP family NTPase n=1 Tax=Reichenbachiella carrageenanivorans TaxID=2979869 RepID=A0ABY6CWT7_9BACT|nr:KAP family NTPase [Reichenbachiella carrageenanivorans]UXX78386.1 KAP family NTPase [Reichenbachiella carrageenanivorans]